MRAQPIHLGHLDVVRKASLENDKVLVFIGSANKSGTKRNPLNIEDRYRFIKVAVMETNLKNVIIAPLNDWSKEDAFSLAKEWGRFFYYNAVNQLGCKTFTFYYNDDIETARNWFDEDLSKRVKIVHTIRERDVSSTQVRNAIINNDEPYLKAVLPNIVFLNRNYIMKEIVNANNEDFVMQ